MGLRDTFKKAAQTAFQAAGDVKETAYYYQRGSVVYNVSTGIASATDSQYVVSMIFSNYNQREIDNESILPTDVRGMIPQNKMTPTPKMDDYIRRVESGSSVTYEIRNIVTDPAGALWEFQLRKA